MKTRDMDRATLITLELFMGAMAIACGVILAVGVAGDVLGMKSEVLDGTPFSNFVIPGLLLAIAVGGSQLVAAYGLWQRESWGMMASFAAGAILMGWIAGEVLILGWISPHGLQPFCFAYGAVVAGLAARHAWTRITMA